MRILTRSLVLGGALTLAVPAVSLADPTGWQKGEERLEHRLQPGKTPTTYRQMLRDMGYTVTSINYNTPNYVEYEVVKNNRTYEVQIDIDDDTGNATNIDIEPNLWKTKRTTARMDRNERMATLNDPNYILVITPVYTVDPYERTALEEMVQELEQLPAELSKGSYRKALEERGYQVLDSAKKNDRIQFRVAKDGKEALVHVRFDENTGRAEQINAFPLLLNVAAQPQTVRSMEKSPHVPQAGEMRRVLQELEALPVARDRSFYRQALRQRGFHITQTTSTDDQTRFEAEKNGQRVMLQVEFDKDTGKSTNMNIAAVTDNYRDSSQLSQRQESQRRQEHMAQR